MGSLFNGMGMSIILPTINDTCHCGTPQDLFVRRALPFTCARSTSFRFYILPYTGSAEMRSGANAFLL